MSARDVASLAYKLAGVYALVQILSLLAPILTAPLWWPLAQEADPPFNVALLVVGQFTPVALMAALGLLPILKSRSLANLTIGEAATAGPALVILGFSLLPVPFSKWVLLIIALDPDTVLTILSLPSLFRGLGGRTGA